MDNNVEERVTSVISSVFGILKEDIKDDASPDTIESWDSLKHMNLVVALEEEFGVQFSDDEIIDLLNYSLIVSTLKGKISVLI